MKKSKITIVGAGLSGMVAGINLAREGFPVEIWEGAKSIGQLEDFHPSVHATLANPHQISSYIHIDVTPAFVPCKRLVIYVQNQPYEFGTENFYMVERGGRATSLDTICTGSVSNAASSSDSTHWCRAWTRSRSGRS